MVTPQGPARIVRLLDVFAEGVAAGVVMGDKLQPSFKPITAPGAAPLQCLIHYRSPTANSP